MKKKRLTISEHKEFADLLYRVRNELFHGCRYISGVYPKGSPQGLIFNQLLKNIDCLRSEMDAQLLKEYPGCKDQTLDKIYYQASGGIYHMLSIIPDSKQDENPKR